jgi:hypothetical protein
MAKQASSKKSKLLIPGIMKDFDPSTRLERQMLQQNVNNNFQLVKQLANSFPSYREMAMAWHG